MIELKIHHIFGILLAIGALSRLETRKLMSIGLIGIGSWWFTTTRPDIATAQITKEKFQSPKLLEDENTSKGYRWKTVWASEKPRKIKYVVRNPDFMNIIRDLRWTKHFYLHWLQRLIDGLDNLQRLYDGMLSEKMSVHEYGDIFTSLRWEIVRYLHGARHSFPQLINHAESIGAPVGNIHSYIDEVKDDFIEITRSMSDYLIKSVKGRPVTLQNALNPGRSKSQFRRTDNR